MKPSSKKVEPNLIDISGENIEGKKITHEVMNPKKRHQAYIQEKLKKAIDKETSRVIPKAHPESIQQAKGVLEKLMNKGKEDTSHSSRGSTSRVKPKSTTNVFRAEQALQSIKLEQQKEMNKWMTNLAEARFSMHDSDGTFLENFHKQMKWMCRFSQLSYNSIPQKWVEPDNRTVSHIYQSKKDQFLEKSLRETFAKRNQIIEEKKAEIEFEEQSDCTDSDDNDSVDTDFSPYKDENGPAFSDVNNPAPPTYDLPSENDIRKFLETVVHHNHVWDVGLHLNIIRDLEKKHASVYMKEVFCPCSKSQRQWLNQMQLTPMIEEIFFKKKLCEHPKFLDHAGFIDHLFTIGTTHDCLLHFSLFYYIYYMYEDQVKNMFISNKIHKMKRIDNKVSFQFNSFNCNPHQIDLIMFSVTR